MTETPEASFTPPTSTDSASDQPNAAAVPLPGLSYRGLARTGQVPPCVISVDDLRRLYTELDRKSQEALDRHLATFQASPDKSQAEFDRLKQQARDVGQLTIGVQGAHGQQIISTSPDVLDPQHLPESVTLITFDSSAALQTYNINLPNRFQIRLDFSEPPGFVTYDPWNQPTPNNSQFEVSGPDDTWVTAVYESVLAFFDRRRKRRQWLHSPVSFTVLNWFLGIPAALWLAYRFDSVLANLLPNLHSALRGAADVYVFLTGFLVFRVVMYWLRWIFPLIELEGARTKGARRFLGGLIVALLVALLYDVLKALVT